MPKPPKKIFWALIALLALTALLAARPRRPGPLLRLAVEGVFAWPLLPSELESWNPLSKCGQQLFVETPVVRIENHSRSSIPLELDWIGIPDLGQVILLPSGYHALCYGMRCSPREKAPLISGCPQTWQLLLSPCHSRHLGLPDGKFQRMPNPMEAHFWNLTYRLRLAPDYQGMVTTGELPAASSEIPDSARAYPSNNGLRQIAHEGGTLWSVPYPLGSVIRRSSLEWVGASRFLLQLADDMDRAYTAGHTHCARDLDGFAGQKDALVVLDAQGQAKAVLLTTPDTYDWNSILTPEGAYYGSRSLVPAVLPVRHQSCGEFLVLHPLDWHPSFDNDLVYLSTPCLFTHWQGREDEKR